MGSDSVPETMFAWRKHRGNMEPVWEEVPVPSVTPTGVLCKMIASGVCHSDYSLLTREIQPAWYQEKFTLGHEGCGEIVQVGDQVTKFKVGDVVALFSVSGCGSGDCPECSRDLPQLCELCHHSGLGQDGFYAPYAAVDQSALAIVPEGVTPSEAAISTDAVTTAYHAVTRRAEVQPSELLFLFGLGGLGFNALQVIKNIGSRVIVSEINPDLVKAAVELGIPESDIVPVGKSLVDFIQESGLYGKVDTVLDFVGKHQTFEDAQHIVRRGGKIVNVGSLDTENTIHMKIGVRKRLIFIFSYGGTVKDLEEVLELIAKRKINPRVTDGKIKDFPTVLKDLHAGKLKTRFALLHD